MRHDSTTADTCHTRGTDPRRRAGKGLALGLLSLLCLPATLPGLRAGEMPTPMSSEVAPQRDLSVIINEKYPELSRFLQRNNRYLPGPLADYVNNNIGRRYIIILPFAFEPTGRVPRNGRVVQVTLRGEEVAVGERHSVTVDVTLTQANGAVAVGRWRTVSGANPNLKMITHTAARTPGFVPGTVRATAVATLRDPFGKVVKVTTWTRDLVLGR